MKNRLAWLALALLVGCTSEGVSTPPPPECSANADCGAGKICSAGKCAADPSVCTSDADCSGGQVCRAGSCAAPAAAFEALTRQRPRFRSQG